MSPVFTNDLLSPSPELDLLEFEEDDDDDEEDDEEALFDGDYNENGNRVNRWNQDDIFSCMTTPTKTLTQLLMVCFQEWI